MVALDDNGLIPAVIQDSRSKQVLMLGYMSPESIAKTYQDGVVWFYSRSRRRLWQKGEESGNYLKFISMRTDCDEDTLLVEAEPYGPTCHTGEVSCFFQPVTQDVVFRESSPNLKVLGDLYQLILSRKNSEALSKSYTRELFSAGISRIGQKVIEESGELSLAAVGQENADSEVTAEAADLLYHVLVLLVARGIEIQSVMTELKARAG